MTEEKKRKLIRKYFSKTHFISSILLLILGISASLFSFSNREFEGVIFIGIIFFLFGFIRLIVSIIRSASSPADKEIDKWLEEDLHDIIKRSLDKLGLDKSQIKAKELLIVSPVLWTTTGIPNKDLLYKKGKDNLVRFAIYRITIIQLADQLMAAYACDFNFMKNVKLNEQTVEYHYRDIASVSTQEISTSYKLPNGSSLVHAQSFRISVTSGENIEVTVSSAKLAEITKGTLPETGAEKAVQVIRVMLRDRK